MKTTRVFLILLFIFVINSTIEIYGQRNIKGRIIDEGLEVVVGAKIVEFNETEPLRFDNLLGSSDVNGFFDVTVSNETTQLIFSHIGHEFARVNLSDSCSYVEVILLFDVIYDFMSSRKIDKYRKKRFDNLSKLYLTAVEKEVFVDETICYSREFESDKPRLDKIGKQMKIGKKQVKEDYRCLSVGDTIKIPFDGSWRGDGTGKTHLCMYSSLVDTSSFDCIVEVIVTKKYRNRYRNPRFPWIGFVRGYNFTCRVLNCDNCKYVNPFFDGKSMEIGEEFEYDMRIFKAIVNKIDK